MTRLLLTLTLLGAVGCGGGATLQVLAYSERFQVAEQPTYVVFGAVLEDEAAWAYGEPAAVVSGLAPRYRPAGTPDAVGAPADAPAPLDALLAEAERTLGARGYAQVAPEGAPALVVTVAHSTAAGATSRVALHLGGEVDGVFRPDWISLALEVDSGEQADPQQLLRDLLTQVPARGGAEAPAD